MRKGEEMERITKSNIEEIINQHQREINELESELKLVNTPGAKRAIKDRLSYLRDNMYRYKLQAKAWGVN